MSYCWCAAAVASRTCGLSTKRSWHGRFARARSRSSPASGTKPTSRSPTPSPTAAAELVSPERSGLLEGISRLTASLALRARQELERRMLLVDHLARRLVHPESRLRAQSELLGQLRLRLGQAAGRIP